MLLVLADAGDNHLPYLLPKLAARGIDHVCLDTAEFPGAVEIDVVFDGSRVRGTVRDRARTWDLAAVTAVWNRRPAPCAASSAYAALQAQHLLDGMWWLLDCAWLPARPLIERRANNKLVNLARAAALGFAIAPTVMTNHPPAFVELYEQGPIVSKAFAYTHLERDGEPYAYQVYTNPVRRRDLANLHAVRHAPAIFQRYVSKQVELRVTVVGDRVFAAEIDSQSSRATRHDLRHYDDASVRYSVHALPREVSDRCVALVHALELSYGAIDLILGPDGDYTFLELNANGQWAGIEARTGLPIGDAIVDWLVKENP